MHIFRLIYLLIFIFLSCTKDDPATQFQDCSGSSNGDSVCGCTDSTAYNYDSNATHDDGSCQTFVDNGDYFLKFNGSNSSVILGDIFDQGAYTKAAWVLEIMATTLRITL